MNHLYFLVKLWGLRLIHRGRRPSLLVQASFFLCVRVYSFILLSWTDLEIGENSVSVPSAQAVTALFAHSQTSLSLCTFSDASIAI